MATLRIFAGHYPERLERVYFVDAPPVFSLLFGAIRPFVDPVTAAKVAFIKSEDVKASLAATAAKDATSGDIDGRDGCRGSATTTVTAAAALQGGFAAYWRFYAAAFDASAFSELLRTLWDGGNGGSAQTLPS
jgi:hypothetical protein